MTRPSAAVALVAVVSCAVVVRAQQPATPRPATVDSTRMAAVTYISGQSVYVSAGRADGVREGMSLDVLRKGSVIATVRAVFLASHSSSCEIVSSAAAPDVGDSVRFRPATDAVTIASADSTTGQAEERPRTSSWRRPIRGHVGVRFLSIAQPNAVAASTVTQPSADFYVQATRIGGTPLGFVIDGRGRRTIGAQSPNPIDERTLVYQASIALDHEASGARVSVGRQYSAALSSVSLFDGVTMELNRSWWSAGGFGGMQPDVATMGYSSEIREAGGYLQVHSEPDGSAPWSVTTGAVSSRDLGQINREYAFTQVAATTGVVSLYATQEVDINRGWKLAAGESQLSPTSTFATVLVRLADGFSLQGGVDNRRNVRLYRDYISPETEFDDAFRQGVWAGASAVFLQRIRIGGDARMSRGGVAGDASYYTGSFGLGPMTAFGLETHLRSTSYRADRAAGWLNALSVGAQPFELARVEVNGGWRTQHLVDTTTSGATTSPIILLPNAQWIGASVDVSLGRSWYVLFSGTRDGTGVDLTNQLYCSLVFRF
jgi:hypothetical protein